MENQFIYDDPTATINSIEASLTQLIKTSEILEKNGYGLGIIPKTLKRSDAEFSRALQEIEYWRFIQSADYHYFLGRILFLNHILSYSKFCGYQCIENYLKAFIKFNGALPKKTHNLIALLNECRKLDNNLFIHSIYLITIIKMYEPFYEVARYPIQGPYPEHGYSDFVPDGIYYLDYFVYKMREILTIPENTWDISKDGHFDLYLCKQNCPDFYNVFFVNNINFTKL